MVKGDEYKKNGNVFQEIPKIFTKNYKGYIDDMNLFKSEVGIKPQCLEDEFYNFSLTEKIFCFLKDGLEEDEKTYKERYQQIEHSRYSHLLKNPLLLIFTHDNFISSQVKTPNLYFETYRIIINGIKINFDELVSIVISAKRDGRIVHNKKLENLMTSKNLDEKDLLYIYFSSQLTDSDLYKSVWLFSDRHNSLSKYLFHSDLNSHIVDHFLRLHNENTFLLILRVLTNQIASGVRYISNWTFNDVSANDMSAITWFKTYMHFKKMKSDVAKPIENYSYVKKLFKRSDVLQPEIMAMIPDVEEGLPFMYLCGEASKAYTGTELPVQSMESQTFFRSSKKIKSESKIEMGQQSESQQDSKQSYNFNKDN